MAAQQAGTQPPSGVLLCGSVPPLADSYSLRPETGPDLARSLRPGQAVALVDGAETLAAPAPQGGTGKTQLAVEFAHAMRNSRAVEVMVWVTAASRESVVSGFAQAANTVDASHPTEDAEAAAARFVSWLAHTRRPWALIIDDLAETTDLRDLWPAGACGRVVITARGSAARFGDKDLTVIPVAGMSRREALSYLTSRLIDNPDQRLEALDLGEDLDGLPLGLAQATAVMRTLGSGCRDYRAQLAERRPHMPEVDGVSASVLATWSIAAECADELPPAGLAWPTLVMAAVLDHHGVPGNVLTSPASCSYIRGRRSSATAADQNMVRAAINNLAEAGLIAIDPASPARTVQMHASVQAAVLAYLPRPRSRAGRAGRRRRAARSLAGRRPRDNRGCWGPSRSGQSDPAGAGSARLRLNAAGQRRRDAVEAGRSPRAVPRRAVARAQQAEQFGHRVLEVHSGH